MEKQLVYSFTKEFVLFIWDWGKFPLLQRAVHIEAVIYIDVLFSKWHLHVIFFYRKIGLQCSGSLVRDLSLIQNSFKNFRRVMVGNQRNPPLPGLPPPQTPPTWGYVPYLENLVHFKWAHQIEDMLFPLLI